MDKEQEAFEEYALIEGISIGKVQGKYFYHETKMALKDFSAGYQARAALDMSEELAKALEELADDFSMYYDDSEHAEGERLHTVFRARKALNKYRERKI